MSLFNIGLSGLNTAQNALTTVGHNISNAATPGYTRQNTLIASAGGQYTSSGFYGQGSNTTSVVRAYDEFLTGQLRNAQSASAQLSTYSDQISQIDNLLADQKGGIAPLMQKFFAAVQGVSDTPADPAARQNMINAGQSLTGQMRAANSYFQQLRDGVNTQVQSSVTQINAYSQQLAKLNDQITRATAAGGGQPPNDLLDQRDQLVSQLTQLVGVKVVPQDNTYNVFVGNGQPLVMGSNSYDLKAVQSSADPSRTTVAYTQANGNVTEMDESTLTGGSLGGLLKFRTESLDSAQNAIGRLSVTLAQTFNDQHKLGVDLTGQIGGNLFKLGTPVTLPKSSNTGTSLVSTSISNTSLLTTSDYTLTYDGTNYSLTRMSDNKVVATQAGAAATYPLTLSADGVNVKIPTAMSANDSYQIQPTRNVAAAMDMAISDPAKIAAAGPLRASAGTTNTGTGTAKVSNVAQGFSLPATAITATYNGVNYVFTDASGAAVVPTSGPTPNGTATDYSFNGVTVSFDGAPKNGDSFTLAPNLNGVSDNGNALTLAKLQTTKTIGGVSSYNDAFAQLVNDVGSRAKSVQIASTSQDSVTTQVTTAQQSISGVNMDEETVSMLRFQQLYQANAKVIQTATTLFDTIIGIGR
ncbi:flagellar hook-associated protein FlgK [Cupriavidus basilensis OR16]|uniref:Flagellar hook-associated protein 1 n=1 Tax=Cupriavidus basilensis OR16 TaxID=1127483 RepID=H1SEQ6_9BURK|nr:flagellar hook-associated protein FlgK [Cupriavidus basilensis]EHP38982.1 flagellar hook-associated protein FlgK [Cupriavidus basilensis OR16]